MVNYIKHMNAAIGRIADDERCTASHASLYHALFYCWNRNRFSDPLFVYRDQLQRISHVASTKVYYQCLRDLESWGYIRYIPSQSVTRPTKIHMIHFGQENTDNSTGYTTDDTTNDSTDDATNNTTHDSTSDTTDNITDTLAGPPYINIINNKNITNKLNSINAYEQAHANSDLLNGKYRNTGNRKGNGKAGKGAEQPGKPENLDQVISYFEEKKSTGAEAEKFHNYFESVGWRVGGRSIMKDWRAAARNWIANSPNYVKHHHAKFEPQLTGEKNYAEPL